jgi:hypothetical protein
MMCCFALGSPTFFFASHVSIYIIKLSREELLYTMLFSYKYCLMVASFEAY